MVLAGFEDPGVCADNDCDFADFGDVGSCGGFPTVEALLQVDNG